MLNPFVRLVTTGTVRLVFRYGSVVRERERERERLIQVDRAGGLREPESNSDCPAGRVVRSESRV